MPTRFLTPSKTACILMSQADDMERAELSAVTDRSHEQAVRLAVLAAAHARGEIAPDA